MRRRVGHGRRGAGGGQRPAAAVLQRDARALEQGAYASCQAPVLGDNADGLPAVQQPLADLQVDRQGLLFSGPGRKQPQPPGQGRVVCSRLERLRALPRQLRGRREDDPERAVLAALAMQEAIQPYAAELAGGGVSGVGPGIEVKLRIGINTGEVIVANPLTIVWIAVVGLAVVYNLPPWFNKGV